MEDQQKSRGNNRITWGEKIIQEYKPNSLRLSFMHAPEIKNHKSSLASSQSQNRILQTSDNDKNAFLFDNRNISFINDSIIDDFNYENSNPNVQNGPPKMQKYKKRQSQIRLNDDSVIQNNFAQRNETKKESLYY